MNDRNEMKGWQQMMAELTERAADKSALRTYAMTHRLFCPQWLADESYCEAIRASILFTRRKFRPLYGATGTSFGRLSVGRTGGSSATPDILGGATALWLHAGWFLSGGRR